MTRSMFLRLCSRAPMISMTSSVASIVDKDVPEKEHLQKVVVHIPAGFCGFPSTCFV
jgi:hypothetical protein